MAKSIRIWQKKQLRLDMLTISQREMVTIGSTGLLSVFKRLSQAKGPNDAAAKPLSKRYAIYKSKLGKGNRRNLNLTGAMLRNLSLRTVSENSARAGLTSRKERIKGQTQTRMEEWCTFSPVNQQDVIRKFNEIVAARTKRLVISKSTGIDLG